MRHTAWLNAAPDPPESKGAKPTLSISRREALDAEGIEPEMPMLVWGEYLLSYLWDVGPTMSGSMGPIPLTYGELHSYQGQIGVQLHPWEVQLIRRLSTDYVAESSRATERDYPAPWQPEEFQPDRRLAAIDQRDAFRNLSKL